MIWNEIDGLENQRALSIFATTADQRYLLGEDLFLRTHFPIKMHQYSGKRVHTVEESDLLEELLNASNRLPGNRLWVIYGTPGSGKSELMKWIETRIRHEDETRAETMVHIPRTDLDVFSIIKRFKALLSESFFTEATYGRWNLARQKPRTLTKLILLFALENLLDSDEVINALFYRLLNAVQPHVEHMIAATEEERDLRSMELMSMETWETIISETTIPVSLQYEQVRHSMTVAFNNHLLNGLSLTDTLRRISDNVGQRLGTRPLLLIDDLVQSLNVFASDILDYFITLEDGNWDVVIGLTPAAFETSQRGKLLLQRITHLDTIDDRVEKLWLSDEAGYDSYILTEENCHEFAARYLAEYQALCNLQGTHPLYPFNREALVRIYRGLPNGKGKTRYFLRHLRTILEAVAQGETLLTTVAGFALTESVARCEDKELAAICELYGPLVLDTTIREITLSKDLLGFFGRKEKKIIVPIEPLSQIFSLREPANEIANDEEKVAIRDWLQGSVVNRQLLHSLRMGAARLLRAFSTPTIIHYPGIANPHGILSWQKPYLEVSLPICIEGVDECDGIPLKRAIGHSAFELHHYAHAMGREAKILEQLLFSETKLNIFLFEAKGYAREMQSILESQLGMSLETLAFGLYLWAIVIGQGKMEEIVHIPALKREDFVVESRRLLMSPNRFKENDRKEWIFFFEDFFKLRDNLYDNPRLISLCGQRQLRDIMEDILIIRTDGIGKEYRWGKRHLKDVLLEWQKVMKQGLASSPQGESLFSIEEWMKRLSNIGNKGVSLAEIPTDMIIALSQHDEEMAHRLRIYLAK